MSDVLFREIQHDLRSLTAKVETLGEIVEGLVGAISEFLDAHAAELERHDQRIPNPVAMQTDDGAVVRYPMGEDEWLILRVDSNGLIRERHLEYADGTRVPVEIDHAGRVTERKEQHEQRTTTTAGRAV